MVITRKGRFHTQGSGNIKRLYLSPESPHFTTFSCLNGGKPTIVRGTSLCDCLIRFGSSFIDPSLGRGPRAKRTGLDIFGLLLVIFTARCVGRHDGDIHPRTGPPIGVIIPLFRAFITTTSSS